MKRAVLLLMVALAAGCGDASDDSVESSSPSVEAAATATTSASPSPGPTKAPVVDPRPSATPDPRKGEAIRDEADPAYLLAVIDARDGTPTKGDVQDMDKRLRRLHRKCPVQMMRLADQAASAQRLVKEEGGKMVSTARIVSEVTKAIPGRRSPFAEDRACTQVFVGFVTVLSS
jgi:hypothetical protein